MVSPSPRSSPPGWDPAALTVDWAPHAIVCAITPFGLTGPNAGWRATPMISYAMSGYMSRVGPVEGPPVTIPGRHCWDEAGAHAAVAVLAALRAAGTVGPQGIDLSVHEILTSKDFVLEEYDAVGLNPLGRLVGVGWPPSGTYQCADGPFSVAAHQVRHWDAFLEMLEQPAELTDPALHDPLVRRERYLELGATIAELVRDRSREDLVARGQAAGLPCGILHRPTGFVADRQLVSRGTFVPTPTPWGEVPMPVAGAGFRATPSLVRGPHERGREPRRRRGVRGGAPRIGRAARAGAGPAALAGIRVLSFGAFVAGNTTAAILGQLGADAVKIEARNRPEVLRTPAYAYDEPRVEPSGVPITIMHASLSRSTRDLSIDVTTPEGRELFHRLVAVADVVIENFGAGVLDAWGLSFDALRAHNPRIVLTSLSGYGRTGPRASYLAYGSNISNFVGLTHLWNYSHGTLSDYVTAAHAALGTLAALEHVAATGEGVWIDAAQVEAMAATMPEAVLEALVNERDLAPPGTSSPAPCCRACSVAWATTRGWRSSSRTSPTGGVAATCSKSRSRSPPRPRRASSGPCSRPRSTGGPPSARPRPRHGPCSAPGWPRVWSRAARTSGATPNSGAGRTRTRSRNPTSARSTTRSRPTASRPRRAASATSVAASAPTPPTCSATGWGWRPTRSSSCSTPAPRSRPDPRHGGVSIAAFSVARTNRRVRA